MMANDTSTQHSILSRENIMSTDSKTETTQAPASSDNKTVFGPLGKYAAVAVIMVSIIVTTAIMLDKQLQSVDDKIAVIEDEVANIHTAEANFSAETNAAPVTTTETPDVVATEESTSEVVAVVEVVEAPQAADVYVATAPATNKPATAESSVTAASEPVQAAAVEKPEVIEEKHTVATENVAKVRQQQLATENQQRIKTYKQEQKKHMSEMFARIKILEAQQLDRYKANQDGQVVRLREQIGQQQQMIETLILRNKELFDMRAASMQRNQDNREQTINRI